MILCRVCHLEVACKFINFEWFKCKK